MSARDSVLQYLNTEAAGLNAKLTDVLVIPYPPTDDQVALYVRESESSMLAWEGCIQFVERYISNSRPIPKPLAKFVITGLRDSKSRPTRRGRSKYTNMQRNFLLIRSIRLALEADPEMNPTRNEASTTTSACDLVADCLKELGVYIEYTTVAKVWNNRQST